MIRVPCGEFSKAKHYARAIVAWAFHRGSAPDNYETFKAEGWEGDHLIDSDEFDVPLGRSSVICGWIKAESKPRHNWLTRVRRAAVGVEKQGKLYAAFVNERFDEKARKQKELDAAAKELQKAKEKRTAELRKLSGKNNKDKKAEALERYEAWLPQLEKIRAEKEKRMEEASPKLKKLWKAFRKPLPKSQKSVERLAICILSLFCICIYISLVVGYTCKTRSWKIVRQRPSKVHIPHSI